MRRAGVPSIATTAIERFRQRPVMAGGSQSSPSAVAESVILDYRKMNHVVGRGFSCASYLRISNLSAPIHGRLTDECGRRNLTGTEPENRRRYALEDEAWHRFVELVWLPFWTGCTEIERKSSAFLAFLMRSS